MGPKSTGGSVTWILDADPSKFEAQIAKARAEAEAFGSSLNKTDFRTFTNNAFGSFSSLGSALKTTVSQIGQDIAELGQKVVSIGMTGLKLGTLAAGAGLAALGVFAVKTASDLQATQISMIGLTKSIDLGTKAMAGAYKFAQKAPFQLKEVSATTKTLIAYGMSADDAVASLELLGNVSITSGINIQSLGAIFGQISSQGKLMLGDIRQLTQDGVAILPALEKEFGKTADQVQQMASDGKISFEQFRIAMASLVDPKILDMLENTLPRQIDRLQGSLRILGFAFIGASVDATSGFKAANDGIYQATVNLTRNIADLLRDPALLAAATAFGNIAASAIQGMANAIVKNKKQIDDFFFGVAAFFNNINKVANTQGIKATFEMLAKDIGSFVQKLNLAELANKLIISTLKAVQKIDFSKYADTITNAYVQVFTAIDYNQLTEQIVKILVKAIPGIITGFVKGIIGAAKDNPLNFAEFMFALGIAPAKIVEGLANALSEIKIVGPIGALILRSLKATADFILAPIKTFFTLIGKNIVEGIKSGFSESSAGIRGVVTSAFSGIATWLIDAGTLLISGLLTGIGIGALALAGAMAGIAAGLVVATSGAGYWLIEHGTWVVVGMVEGIKRGVPILLGYMSFGMIGALVALFATSGSWLIQQGRTLIDGFVLGIQINAGKVWSAIKSASDQIGQFFAGAGSWLYGVGKAIVQGLVNGMQDMIGSVTRAAGNIGDAVKNKVKSLLGIHSPSKVFREIGMNITQGFVDGIASGMSQVQDAAAGLSTNVQVPAMAGVEGQSQAQAPQIDLTQNIYNDMDMEQGLRDLSWRLKN